MKKITRTPAPDWLTEKCDEWGRQWQINYHRTQDSGKFRWRRNRKKGKDDLLRDLSAMTQHHCSFCDAYPMGRRLQPTIEHFRPKTIFPLLAYKWDNLFLCCRRCQEKGDNFDEKLLKPDADDYDFDTYFAIEWATGELKPNPVASSENQKKAEITIKLYKLNQHGKPEDRVAELEKFEDSNNPDINEWSYRFFIERAI